MDVMVLIGLGAAVGLIVLLFLVTKLIRMVRETDEFEFDQPRRFRWSRSKPVSVAATAPGRENGRSDADADVAVSALGPPERVAADEPLAALAQYVPSADIPSRRSVPVKESQQLNDDYGRLGEQVTAVLTTAEHAAAEIRESASREAEQIRLDAEKQVAEARAEAETLRSDADAYREEMRAEADSYAEETRRAADADAAKARGAAEEKTRAIEAEAYRKAQEIEAEALRRRDALRDSAGYLEDRIAGMLEAFRVMTTNLEGLLPAEPKRESGEPQAGSEVVIDDTLEDALKPERAA